MVTNKKEDKISTLLEDLDSLENYIRDLFNFLPLPIFLLSPAKIILEVNPAFENLTEYKIEEVIGESIEALFDPEEIDLLANETLEKGSVRAKTIFLTPKSGGKIPISVSTMLRKSEDGDVVGYFFSLFNLTDVKKKEKELVNAQKSLLNILEDTEFARRDVESEKNKTLSIINNFVDGIFVFDETGKVSFVNPQAEKLFNIKNKPIIGCSIKELGALPEFSSLVEVLGGEIKEISRKELNLRENLNLEVSVVFTVNNNKRGETLVILHDITREKGIEKTKTGFVSLAAHQLRTPLSAIKWILKMMLDGDVGEITKEQREFLEKSYASNERMINLINDLLDVTRIEEGRYLYKPAPADIADLAQSVVDSSQEEIKRKNIKLAFQKPKKSLPKVKVDSEKIKIVIQNLLDNAVKYTFSGGEVTMSINYAKKEIEFSIKDNGVGIPKDQQEKIFTKFFRGANVVRMETDGSGIGLFISKNIVDAHGGKIWFESEEGKGTTFYFTLPTEKEFEEFSKEF